MKKCWVKIEVTSYTELKNQTRWVKGKLISHNIDTNKYEVFYKYEGPKTKEFDRENYSVVKPDELKRKISPVQKRTFWYKLLYMAVHISFIFLYVENHPDVKPIFEMTFGFINWIVMICAGTIFDNFMEMIIRQEEIHKMLKESVSDDMKNCGNCGKSIDAFGTCRDSAFGNSCDKWQFEPEYRG